MLTRSLLRRNWDAEKIEESYEKGIAQEDLSCPYCQNIFSLSRDVMKHMEEHWIYIIF